MMKGCYCLVIDLEKSSEIKIGKLGKIKFKNGHYVYVGSAMNSLKSRVNRHLSKEKRLHWHVDYLLKKAKIEDVIFNISDEKIECNLSGYISKKACGVNGFGCSDCDCESHLYYFKNRNEAIECVKDAYDSIAMRHYDLKYFNENFRR
jgi:Uri superfamily endonuclease